MMFGPLLFLVYRATIIIWLYWMILLIFCWTFLLHHKSDVHEHIIQFISYAQSQFSLPIKFFQTNNDKEFINNATTAHLASRGILFRHSCPYTSSQNGKAASLNVFFVLLIILCVPC